MRSPLDAAIAVDAFLGEAGTAQVVRCASAALAWTLYLGIFPSDIARLAVLAGAAFVASSVARACWAAATPASLATSAAAASCVAYALYARWAFSEWERAFAGHRLTRRAPACASNRQLPDVVSKERSRSKILENAGDRGLLDVPELVEAAEGTKREKGTNRVGRERARRRSSLTPVNLAAARGLLERKGSLSEVKAQTLDMDHIYVKFSDFLWAYTFIVPFSYILWRRRTLVLRLRKFLHKLGVIRPRCDYEALAAALLLEQTQAIHYYGRTYDRARKKNIAGFLFADFPYVDHNCEFRVAKLFAVDVDLDAKRFEGARLDGEELTAREAVTLLWFNTITAQHVKLHAMANWGVNLDDSLDDANPFLRRNGVVTAMYNFFGYTMFNGFTEAWADQGLVSPGWAGPGAPLVRTFDHGIRENVWQHSHIKELTKHSRLVKFVMKVRAIFLFEFNKHKDLFPGVNGEAMFVGTILHSLDHTFMDWNMKDALYLDTTDNRFGKMAELGQVVKVGFVSDVDGLYFHKRFKNSGHPFYEAVYRKAAKIDKELADHMDTCIVK